MTERWERELEKLRQAEPADDVWHRAQRGPSGDPLPPRRQRIVAGVVAMSVFLAAGVFGWNALREHPGAPGTAPAGTAEIRYTVPGPADPVTIRLHAIAEAPDVFSQPTMHIAYAGQEQDIPAQDLTDWVGPAQGSDDPLFNFPAEIPLGAPLTFGGDATSVTAEIENEAHEGTHTFVPLPITDGVAQNPGPGTFLLRVRGTWGIGSAGFTVQINVYDDITLGTGAAPPTASMTLGDVSAEAVVTSYKWNGLWSLTDPSLADAPSAWPPTVDAFTPIPQGTNVTVDGPDLGAPPQLELWDPTFQQHVWGPSSDWSADPPFGVAPGRYVLVLEVDSNDEGPSTVLRFAFGVEVVPAPTEAPVAPAEGATLALQSTDLAPEATLGFGASSQAGTRASYEWCDGSGQCVSGVPDFATYPPVTDFLAIPAGAPLEITGDAVSSDITLVDVKDGKDLSGARAWNGSIPDATGRYALRVEADWGARGNAVFWFGIEVVPASQAGLAAIPDVLHVSCSPGVVDADTPEVRPQSDGVHVVVDASPDVTGAVVVQGQGRVSLSGIGVDANEDGIRGIPIEPGTWYFGCNAKGSAVGLDDLGTHAAPAFTVVDPEGIYVPVDLACDAPTTRTFGVVGTDITADSIAAVPGILPSDTVKPSGYPDGPGFKTGPLLTVLRDGSAVARIRLPFEATGSWTVTVDACPGSGVGPDAAPGAAGPVPDVAVVRCDGNGSTQVMTPIANAQADGLHLSVQNLAGAAVIVVSSAWDRSHPQQAPLTADQAKDIVLPMHPGPVVMDCHAQAGDGIADPFVSHTAGDLQLQDPAGFFVPDGLACGSSEQVPLVPPNVRLLPSGEAYINGNLGGVRTGDVVERAGYLEGRGDEGLWRIVRDGAVIARVDYPSLEGVTCKGSGINGA